MLVEGVKVLYKGLKNSLTEHPVPASRMNSQVGEADDEGLGRSSNPPVVDNSDERVDKTNNHVTALTPADNKRPWVCGHCNKSFGSARALKIHEVKQHESASRHFLKCGNCDEVFEHTNLLQIHMRVHHNVRVRCLRCKDMFDNPAMLRVHFKEHHSDPICLACGLKFDHDKLLRLHMEHYHKVGGKATKKDMMAFCEELSVKMASPASGDVTTNSPPDPEEQISPRAHCGSLKPEGGSIEEGTVEAEWDPEQSNGSLRTRQSPSECNVGMKAPVTDAIADVQVEVEKNDVAEGRNKRLESQGTPEDRLSPLGSPLPTPELNRERDEVTSTQRAFHSYNDKKGESSMPFGNENREVASKMQEKADGVEMASVGVDQRNLQSQRPSVKGESSMPFGNENRDVASKMQEKADGVEMASVGVDQWNLQSQRPSVNKGESSMPFGIEKREVASKMQEKADDVEMASLGVDQRNLQSQRPSVNKGESSMPFANENREVASKMQERMDDVEMASVGVDQQNLQSQRPSVITTVSCSERLCSRTKTEQAWVLDTTIVRDALPSTVHEMRPDSQSPALKDEPSDDRMCWEEGSLAFDQRKLLARRPAPRCNRCQKWFPSKMEYLHHLISHQDAESQCVQSAEGSSDGDDTENIACIDEDKAFGFRGYKRWSVPDIRRPVTGPIGHFSGFNAAKRHSVPDIRPHPVPSDNASSLNRGLYGTVACSECMSVFFDSRSCKIHIEKRHMKPECRECGLQFDHKNLHKIHMNSYHSANPVLECYVCRQQFKERSEFVSHLTSHETQTVRLDVKSPPTNLSANVEAELPGARRDENLVGDSDSSRNHKREDTDEADETRRAQREDHRETRTRIFMPQFREVRYESRRETAIDRPLSLGFPHLDGEKRLDEHSSVESQPEKYHPRVNGLIRTASLERLQPVGAAAGTKLQDDRTGLLQVLKPTTEESKAENNLGGPPPLISVGKSPTTKAETFVDERNSVSECEGGTRTFHSPPSRIPAVPVAFRPSDPFSPWSRMKGRDGAAPELPKREHMLDVQPLTKKALFNSLCLRRRASAPELTRLHMPKLVESAEGRTPVVATKTSIEPDDAEDQNDAKVLDARGMKALSSATSFRARQMAMRYQPRRSQPGDFNCQRCGIFFGHKKLLKIHLDSYHGNSQSLQCLHCSLSFDDRAQFLDHVVAHQDGSAILKKGTSNVVQRRKRSAPEVSIRSTHLESLYNKAIMNSKRARMDDNDKESTRSEEPSSPRSESPRSDEELSIASRHEVGSLEGDEEPANFCFVCGKSFDSGKELDQHVSSHAKLDEEGRYCCSLCQKSFDHHRKLEIHTRSHTGFKPHKCEYCGRCFPYYSSYYYHKMTHTDRRPHKCELCGRGFIQARYLRAHLKNHKVEESPREEVLTEELEESKESAARTDGLVQIKIELNDHHQQFMAGRIAELEKDASTRDPELRSCENSGSGDNKSDKATVSESEKWDMRHRVGAAAKSVQTAGETASLVHGEDFKSTHRVSLPDTKLDKVEVVTSKGCEPVVVVQSPANDLKTTPKPGKRYQCKHCQKRFSSYSSLYVHTRLHTGQRPYTCKYCNKRFTHASGMKRHVRCHTGERPYPCTYCPSAFADRGALRSHIRTHTGERPYKCDLCEKTFTQSSSLRVHKKTVHMQHRDPD